MAPADERKAYNARLFEAFRGSNRKIQKRRFGQKPQVIDDLCFALMHTEHFHEDLMRIRERHRLPENPDPVTDIQLFESIKTPRLKSSSSSLFWEKHGIKKEEAFDKDIQKIIDTYEHIPSSLFRWVKHVAMYQKQIPWQPTNDVTLLLQLLKNPMDISKLPLTTEEKKTLLTMARNLLGMKLGRPSKKVEQLYESVYRLVMSHQNKNPFRGTTLTKGRARKTLSLRKEYESYHAFVIDEYEESTDEALTKRHDKKVNNARQMKHRLQKRIAELAKKKVKK